ncbi:hypothetical protein DL767_000464 [Monosporascus sp. MG133]|nr:hypothetical protein DL767_000464 [Monosporascus sp. MG133]
MRICLPWIGLLVHPLLVAASDQAGDGTRPQLYRDDQGAEYNLAGGALDIEADVLGIVGTEPSTLRHREEKERLLGRLSKKSGNWNLHHPRWRLLKTLWGFSKYRDFSYAEVNRWRDMYKKVTKQQKATLESAVGYRQKLNNIEHLIDRNAVVCDAIVEHAMQFYGIEETELKDFIRGEEEAGRSPDRTSVLQSLKHYVRDWASEGAHERDAAFPCILETLRTLSLNQSTEKSNLPIQKVLLPGAGLGALGYEVANLGEFEVTQNEWSTYMLAVYRYLEANPAPNSIEFHPFIDGLSHHATTSNLMRAVTVPNKIFDASKVLMVEGDFTQVFWGAKGQYDVVVTHFFIDTARNLMSYLETIHQLLRTGGYWINFGPLLYGTGPFVQLSLDEIVAVSESIGFEFEDLADICGALTAPDAGNGLAKVRSQYAAYGFDERELKRNAYMAQAWLARKR